MTPGRRFWDVAPLAHRGALAGIALFAAGGLGDALWHEVFGVETSLDALLSPTHLLLFIGMLLIVSTPLRAAWMDRSDTPAPSFAEFSPALASLTFSTALVAFFFEYAWVLAQAWVPRQFYFPNGADGELFAAFGVIGIMVTTLISMPPMLLVVRRWRPPFGAFVVLFVAVNLFIAVAFDEDLTGLLPAALAGLVADVLYATRVDRRVPALLVPAVLWSAYFAVVGQMEGGLRWPPEIWGGAVFFASLATLAMQLGLDAAAGLATPATDEDTAQEAAGRSRTASTPR